MKTAWSQFWLPWKGVQAQGCPRTAGLQARPQAHVAIMLSTVDAFLHVQQHLK